MKALHRLWPHGWWPDQRTLGLLIFGFFGASAFTALVYARSDVSVLLNLQTPNEISYVAPWERVTSGAMLVGGVAELVAALGGLALMVNLPRARVITTSGIGLASVTLVLTLVVAPLGFSIPSSLADVILDIAIVVLVLRWQPRRAGTRSMSSGNSAADGGTEAAQRSS